MASAFYQFNNVAAGSYMVAETQAAGFFVNQATRNGGDPELDRRPTAPAAHHGGAGEEAAPATTFLEKQIKAPTGGGPGLLPCNQGRCQPGPLGLAHRGRIRHAGLQSGPCQLLRVAAADHRRARPGPGGRTRDRTFYELTDNGGGIGTSHVSLWCRLICAARKRVLAKAQVQTGFEPARQHRRRRAGGSELKGVPSSAARVEGRRGPQRGPWNRRFKSVELDASGQTACSTLPVDAQQTLRFLPRPGSSRLGA